jgi:YVTN family beta-propeller protein
VSRVDPQPLKIAIVTTSLVISASMKLLAADWLSPCALAAAPDGRTVYVACATGNRVLCFDTANRKVAGSISMPGSPSGLALSADGRWLYVTCAAPESKVCAVDVATRRTVTTIPSGHTTMSPVVSADGKSLYVCNRFNNDVGVIDLNTKKEVRRIAVQHEPVAADLTKDGKYLLVANRLHNGRADVGYVAAVVSVIDTTAGKVVKELRLPNGGVSLNDIRVSPDGKYALVTHILARFSQLPTHVGYGWINANAMTIVDLVGMRIQNTALLDDDYVGAANPWGIAWSADSKTVLVAHAGTHEISVIDFQSVLARLPEFPWKSDVIHAADPTANPPTSAAQTNDLTFFVGARHRVKLPGNDLGPRAVAVVGDTTYAANYFTDTLTMIDFAAPQLKPESVPLGPKLEMNSIRRGEFFFHDAGICYEGWQSCASCHPGDARADGLNWDLLNDGVGNPKNTKSLLLAHRTPPAMSLGVRATAETAVRAGIRHMLFTTQPEEVASSIDEYLKSLKPVPSPHLMHGRLSEPAKRGEKIFSQAGCAICHPPGLYTDLRPHDVGTRAPTDKPSDEFYTPTLVEIWRTAPYLHDGSAATIRDVVTTRNPHDQHGETSNLSSQEIDDLCAYVLSL